MTMIQAAVKNIGQGQMYRIELNGNLFHQGLNSNYFTSTIIIIGQEVDHGENWIALINVADSVGSTTWYSPNRALFLNLAQILSIQGLP